jgi:probable F420-dependent oxidoreductase
MRIGVTVRNMGPQSTREVMRSAVLAAEALGFESVWITDHIAIPPDDAEGSGGRYTDPLTTLAWIAGFTDRINLGVGVLIVPYRAALPTIKQIATVQELSAHRLLLGLAVGWMDAEFRALGVDRHQRGKLTDDALELLRDCFAADVVTHHGQPFIFSPRPPAPPVYIGGSAPHALKRALRFGHGWIPMVRDPVKFKPQLAQFAELAAGFGTEPGPVTVMGSLPVDDPGRARDLLDQWRDMGIERLVCGMRYETIKDLTRSLDLLSTIVSR